MGVYHITASNGHVYEVQAANDAQAQRMHTFIESRIHAGDDRLTGGTPPDRAVITHSPDEDPNATTTRALADNFVQGGTANWGDEISAYADAMIPGLAALDNYMSGGDRRYGGMAIFGSNDQEAAAQHNLEVQRQQLASDQAVHPVASSAGDLAGTLTSVLAPQGRATELAGNILARVLPRAAIPAAARVASMSVGSPVRYAMARGAMQGGVYGTVAGAGAGDGNRAQSAAMGGISGAMLGSVLDPAVSTLIPAIGRYASAMFGRAPHEEAVRQIITSLQRDGFDLTRPAAVQALRTELARYGGRPVSLADIGAATRARAGVGLRSPSDVQQQSIDQVLARTQGQGVRLRRDILDNVAPRTDVHALNDDLVAQRAQEAERLRQAALFEGGTPPSLGLLEHSGTNEYGDHVLQYTPNDGSAPVPIELTVGRGGRNAEVGINENGGTETANTLGVAHVRDAMTQLRGLFPDLESVSGKRISGAAPGREQSIALPPPPDAMQTRVVSDPQIIQLMQHPNMQRALPAALTRSRNEFLLNEAMGQSNEHLGTEALSPEQLQNIMDISHGGMMDMRTLDTVKRYLDDEVNNLYRRGQGSTFSAGEAGQVRQLRDALRTRMREVVPEYGHYLDQYAGSSDMIDALEQGRNFRNLDPEEITAGQAGRSTAARELYRVAAARDLTDVLNATSDRANPASRILNSPEARAQLDALGLQPGAADRLNTAVGQERQLNQLPAEMANSATDARAAARADAEITPNIPYISANPINWFGAAARWAANHASTQRMAGINQELLPRVLETNPTAVDAIIRDLAESSAVQRAAALRRSQRGSAVGRFAGQLIGAPVALPQQPEN